MVLREAFFAGIGALTGGVVSGVVTASRVMQGYRLAEAEHIFSPYKPEYGVKPFLERGEFSFTYYYDAFKGAFNKVGVRQIEALRARGYTVEAREVHEYLVARLHPFREGNNFAFVHPLFFTHPTVLDYLKRCHRYIIAFEVADSTKISVHYTRYANDPRIDGIFLPSTFAIEAYRRSGVMNRLFLVSHGVDQIYGKPRREFRTEDKTLRRIRADERIKILWFGLHSLESRKGAHIVRDALKRLKEKGRNLLLVVKTHPPPLDWKVSEYFSDIPTVRINTWLLEEDLIYLYDSCDILLHPYRGGAFELNVLEALARGLPVVVTGWGSVLDYANIHNAYLIQPESAVRMFPLTAVGHVGYGVEPSVDHAVELLEFVIDNLDYCRKKAERQRGEFAQRSWDKVADRILEGCREVWQLQ